MELLRSAAAPRRVAVALMVAVLALCCPSGALSARAAAQSFMFGLDVWRVSDVPGFSRAIGVRPQIVGIYRDWVHSASFPTSDAAAARAAGAVPLIAWEPWDSWTAKTSDPAFSSAQILTGRYDALIKRWASQAKTYGGPVWIRFAPEQNGDWRPWSIGTPGNAAWQYRSMWRHVVGLFRAAGASNVRWVWNPYVDVGGSTPLSWGFPGTSYVDMIGLDGFNWGSTRPWGWQSYDDIFASSVKILRSIAPATPWFIAETASARGSGRATWVSQTVASARRDGALGLVWFEFNKETDWRISNDPASCQALRSALAR